MEQIVRTMCAWRLPVVVICCAELLVSCAATETVVSKEVPVAAMLACNAPGRCGQPLFCEGSLRSLVGTVDQANIFDRRAYPALPFQKFLVRPAGGGEAVEVWVEASRDADSVAIFELVHAAAASKSALSVVGKAVGVDLPISGQCNRVIKLVVEQKNAVRLAGGDTAGIRKTD